MTFVWLSTWLTLGCSAVVSAQFRRAPALPDEARTNGALTIEALEPLLPGVRASAVEVLREDGSPVLRGVMVSELGYFLSKASELPADKNLMVRVDGTECTAQRVQTDRGLDIALLKASVPGVPVSWAMEPLKPGHWVTSAAATGASSELSLKLGVMSATCRPIRTQGAGMGIQMANDTQGQAVRIVDISLEGPANDAGLQPGDMLLAVNGESTRDITTVKSIMRSLTPGEQVAVKYRRGVKEKDCQVRLASLSRVVSNFDGEDYGNGGVSLRTDGFSMVLEHATPLTPADMGGALYDLKGNAVGINIARVDRVTTFALPASEFWTKAQDWISQHRQQQKP